MKLEHISLHWNAGSSDYTVSFDLGMKDGERIHSFCDLKQHAGLIETADKLEKWALKLRQLAQIEEWEQRAKTKTEKEWQPKEHTALKDCWCGPVQVEDGIWVHNYEH